MGCCCSCLKNAGSAANLRSETEMSSQNGTRGGGQGGGGSKELCIARTMTQPTIAIQPGGTKVTKYLLDYFCLTKRNWNTFWQSTDFLNCVDIREWVGIGGCWNWARCGLLGMAHHSSTRRRCKNWVWCSTQKGSNVLQWVGQVKTR